MMPVPRRTVSPPVHHEVGANYLLQEQLGSKALPPVHSPSTHKAKRECAGPALEGDQGVFPPRKVWVFCDYSHGPSKHDSRFTDTGGPREGK